MIKKLLLAILIALPCSALAQKFGVVDVQAIFQAMPETTAAQTQLTEASKKYEDEFAKLNEEMNKKVTEFQTLSKDTTTPESIKQRRMEEMQELDNKIQQFRNTAAQDLQRQQEQLMAPIEQKINDAVKAVGQEGNYTFIIQNGVALYNGVTVEDVTPAVKTQLGIKYTPRHKHNRHRQHRSRRHPNTPREENTEYFLPRLIILSC